MNSYDELTSEYDYEKSLESVIQKCEATVNYMITYIINSEDLCDRKTQLLLLRDTLQICISTAIFMAADSQFINDNVCICGIICETCGKECLKFSDQMSQNCARECIYCAKACENYLNNQI